MFVRSIVYSNIHSFIRLFPTTRNKLIIMTISNILEHWATIYKPLSHNPESERLEDQRFFRIRYIDLENTFSRNANVLHSPCMLQSVITTGELVDARKAEVSHQVWFLSKLNDSSQTLGRFNGTQLERATEDLTQHCLQLISWLMEVKRTGVCPVTGRKFAEDAQLMAEVRSIDPASFSFGLIPKIYTGQWLVAGVDWKTFKPLYAFACGMNGNYILPTEGETTKN